MAFYIRISKADESESSARYIFEAEQGRRGVLSLNKLTGLASLIEPMPGDERHQCFNRAAVKIGRAWEAGELPDLLEWAS